MARHKILIFQQFAPVPHIRQMCFCYQLKRFDDHPSQILFLQALDMAGQYRIRQAPFQIRMAHRGVFRQLKHFPLRRYLPTVLLLQLHVLLRSYYCSRMQLCPAL